MSAEPSPRLEIGGSVARAAERFLQQWFISSGDEWGSSSSSDEDDEAAERHLVRRRWRRCRPQNEAPELLKTVAQDLSKQKVKKALQQFLDIEGICAVEKWQDMSRGVRVVRHNYCHFVPAADVYAASLSLNDLPPESAAAAALEDVVEWHNRRSLLDELRVLANDLIVAGRSEDPSPSPSPSPATNSSQEQRLVAMATADLIREEYQEMEGPQIIAPHVQEVRTKRKNIIPAPGIFVDVSNHNVEPEELLSAPAPTATAPLPSSAPSPLPQHPLAFRLASSSDGTVRQIVNWCFSAGEAFRAEQKQPWCDLGRPLAASRQEERRRRALELERRLLAHGTPDARTAGKLRRVRRQLAGPSLRADVVCEWCLRPMLPCHLRAQQQRREEAPRLLPPYAILFFE